MCAGSAIFNILIIIGATVLATGNTLQLDWKPVTRDCFFYAAAIAGIVGTFAGGRIDWWEGLIYVLFYGCYIVSMVYNQRLMKWMDSWKTVESFGSFKKNFSFSKRPPGHFQHGGAAEMKEITTLTTIPDGDENLSEEQIELKVVKGKVKLEVTPPTSPTKSPLAPASSSSGSATGPAKAKAGWAKLRKTVVTEHKFADAVLAVKDKWKDKATLLNADAAKDVAPGSPRESAKITPTMTLGHIRAYRAEAARVASNLAVSLF